jgi:hypothetical protein
VQEIKLVNFAESQHPYYNKGVLVELNSNSGVERGGERYKGTKKEKNYGSKSE